MDNQMVGWNTDSTEQTLLPGVDLQRHVTKAMKPTLWHGRHQHHEPGLQRFPGFDESTATHPKTPKGLGQRASMPSIRSAGMIAGC